MATGPSTVGCGVPLALETLVTSEDITTQHLIVLEPRRGQAVMATGGPRTPTTGGGRAEDLGCLEGLQTLEDMKHLEA